VLGWCVCMQRGKEGGEGSEKGDVGSSSRVQNVRANNQNPVQRCSDDEEMFWRFVGEGGWFPLNSCVWPRVCVLIKGTSRDDE